MKIHRLILTAILMTSLTCSTLKYLDTQSRLIRSTYERVKDTVVFIRLVRTDYQVGNIQKQFITGSGVIIDKEGHVITNYHVIEKQTRIMCLLNDRREIPAKIIGVDKVGDIALLKLLPGKTPGYFKYADFGDSLRVRTGDFILSLTNPLELKWTYTHGIVGHIARYLAGVSEYYLWIQSQEATAPGCSGGPLFDLWGDVIAIHARTAIRQPNIHFSIPVNYVKQILPDLKRYGKVRRIRLGLKLQPLRDIFGSQQSAQPRPGVLISEVEPDSPAYRVGLIEGDILLQYRGKKISGWFEEDLPLIRNFISQFQADEEKTDLVIERQGKAMRFTLNLAKEGKIEGDEFLCKIWKLSVKEITENDSFYYWFKRAGVYILGSRYGGTAYNADLKSGDIILKINDQSIDSLDQFKKIYQAVILKKVSQSLKFEYLRYGHRLITILDYQPSSEE